MSDCRFGVSPVNYPDPDPGSVLADLGRDVDKLDNNCPQNCQLNCKTHKTDGLHPKMTIFKTVICILMHLIIFFFQTCRPCSEAVWSGSALFAPLFQNFFYILRRVSKSICSS